MNIAVIWDTIILSPMINFLVILSQYLFNSFGLTIIVLTLIIRLLMYPLTIKQLQASKAMQSLQPKLAELQKKYAKDKEQFAREQMRLFKESGVSTAGCATSMLVQLPVWIALYQSIIRVLAVAPEDFLELSRHLYPSWSQVFSLVPLESKFLWLDLAVPDKWMILSILVFGTMWVQQKMTTPTTTDPKQQSQAQLMLWTMPLMFAIWTLTFPSGLALYWVVSNVIGIVTQYLVIGWGGLVLPTFGRQVTKGKKNGGHAARLMTPSKDKGSDTVSAEVSEPKTVEEEELSDGESGDKRQDRGGSNPTRLGPIKRKSGKGKGNRPKRG